MRAGKSFGRLIADLRLEKGLSVYALAQRAGVSDQAVHDLEKFDRQPSLETARRLAEALGVTLEWIVNQLPPLEMPEPTPGRPRGRPPKSPPAADPAAPAKRPGRKRNT
jgi:transcriptional regulator with XRE-family HTH domain